METTHKKKILVIEDEPPLLRAEIARLRIAGFEAVPASTGAEAIDIMQKDQFDAIILDLMLPDLDGFEILSKIKELKLKVPVIVVTALSQAEDRSRAMSLGAVDYLHKGDVSLVDLADKIKEILKK